MGAGTPKLLPIVDVLQDLKHLQANGFLETCQTNQFQGHDRSTPSHSGIVTRVSRIPSLSITSRTHGLKGQILLQVNLQFLESLLTPTRTVQAAYLLVVILLIPIYIIFCE
eukprot:Blabericola_migrator_1__5994@NODE_3020_length_2105_cov_25_066241_g1701_i1_p2_GENE_NODE_3020_length_2105_cov_25_066241_g1701_i1NODE_3020_length_2105_cov_25_066241_g1701_i1_p2_ORF_typecomplete_len111_score15_06RimM/PF01782_18/0_21_NODE_3020_length_2105_cov_25_066241_g1701_i116101942